MKFFIYSVFLFSILLTHTVMAQEKDVELFHTPAKSEQIISPRNSKDVKNIVFINMHHLLLRGSGLIGYERVIGNRFGLFAAGGVCFNDFYSHFIAIDLLEEFSGSINTGKYISSTAGAAFEVGAKLYVGDDTFDGANLAFSYTSLSNQNLRSFDYAIQTPNSSYYGGTTTNYVTDKRSVQYLTQDYRLSYNYIWDLTPMLLEWGVGLGAQQVDYQYIDQTGYTTAPTFKSTSKLYFMYFTTFKVGFMF